MLVVGGVGEGSAALDSTEIYRQRGSGPLAFPLPSRKILAIGDEPSGAFCAGGFQSADVYDPATGVWSLTGRMR